MPRKKAANSDGTVQKWQPPIKGAFLDALRTVRFVTQACDLVQVPRSTVYDWRDHDPAFRDAMDEAELRYADTLRDEAHKRAMGEDGRQRSDDLLKALLKAKVPEFQDKAATQVNITFVQMVVGRIQGLVQRFFPISCPHCGKHLEGRKLMAQELARLDAIEMTAAAVTPE